MEEQKGRTEEKLTRLKHLKLLLFVFIAPVLLIISLAVLGSLLSLHNYLGYESVDYPYIFFDSIISFLSQVLFSVILFYFVGFVLLFFGMIFWGRHIREHLMSDNEKGGAAFLLIPVIFQSLLIVWLFTDMVYVRFCSYSTDGAVMELILPLVATLAGIVLFLYVFCHIIASKPIDKERRGSLSGLSIIISLTFIFSFTWVIIMTSSIMCDRVITGFVKFPLVYNTVDYNTDGSYHADLRNGLGLPVAVKAVSSQETLDGVNCSVEAVGLGGGNKVVPGGLLTLKGICPEKSEGESFDLILMFNYTVYGQNITHMDMGHIRGQAG